jgi:hypothetical protein
MWAVHRSRIHGRGVFVTQPMKPGQTIDRGIERVTAWPRVTDFGSLINHSSQPTCELLYDQKSKTHWVVARVNLPSLSEITVDYNRTPWYIANADPAWS